MARTGKEAVFGDGVLRRTRWCAGHEGVPSQDAALVFQGILPGAADTTDSCTHCRGIFVDAIRVQIRNCIQENTPDFGRNFDTKDNDLIRYKSKLTNNL